jgi:hypothetical protein
VPKCKPELMQAGEVAGVGMELVVAEIAECRCAIIALVVRAG